MLRSPYAILILCAALPALPANGPDNVVVIANNASALSKNITEYYSRKRHIPVSHICYLNTITAEHVSREQYSLEIEAPIANFLKKNNIGESTLYLVTTSGVPLIIDGGGSALESEIASVDSELTLVYQVLHGQQHPTKGPLNNPYFRAQATFSHPRFPMYLVTRLSAWDFNDVKAMIDKALIAKNQGFFVLDQSNDVDKDGNNWIHDAMLFLPTARTIYDATTKVLYNQKNVIAYASWGSNDPNRKERHLGNQWLPGAIATEYVSTNARTMSRPPDNWNIGNDWNDRSTHFHGSPQSLTTDYIHDGATAASGQVNEPYLQFCPRPQYIFPAYYRGEPMAEAFYRGIPAVSWMNIILGDPLLSLGPP